MTPELGHLALILALLVALTQGVLPLVGAHRGAAGWMALARPAAQTQFVLVAFAFGCLMAAFVANDFSVVYVAQHSNSLLPTAYRAPSKAITTSKPAPRNRSTSSSRKCSRSASTCVRAAAVRITAPASPAAWMTTRLTTSPSDLTHANPNN